MDIDLDNVEILDIGDTETDLSEVEEMNFDELSETEISEIQEELEPTRSLEDIQAEKEALLNLKERILESYGEWAEGEESPQEKELILTRHR